MTMKPLLIVALSAALLGGCSSTPLVSGSADQVQAPTEAISQSTLPPGATMKPELSLIIGSGDQWVGRVVATVGKDIDAAIRFFIDIYQGQGWTLISSVRGKSSLLVFTRQDRTATVELVEGGLMSGGTVTLTVAPRNATVVAPKRP